MSAEPEDGPILLIAQMRVRDARELARYGREVEPMMARYGGRIVGISVRDGEVVETGVDGDELIAIHRWPSRQAFREFFASAEYQPLKELRHAAADTRITLYADRPPTP